MCEWAKQVWAWPEWVRQWATWSGEILAGKVVGKHCIICDESPETIWQQNRETPKNFYILETPAEYVRKSHIACLGSWGATYIFVKQLYLVPIGFKLKSNRIVIGSGHRRLLH